MLGWTGDPRISWVEKYGDKFVFKDEKDNFFKKCIFRYLQFLKTVDNFNQSPRFITVL